MTSSCKLRELFVLSVLLLPGAVALAAEGMGKPVDLMGLGF